MKKIYGHKDTTGGKYPHDDTYTIEGYVRMKSPETGEWYDAVLYKSTTKGEVFCCERNDFEEKFKVEHEIKEYVIGEEFQFKDTRLRCVKEEGLPCEGCYFHNIDMSCVDYTEQRGYCTSTSRTDKTSVIFVEVEQ